MPRYFAPQIAVVFGYVCLAVVFSWPLPMHLGSALTGDPGGDTGVYVWNQWVFQEEAIVKRTNPLSTDHILAMTDPVDLSQHNYTLFLNVLALPLLPFLGVVTTFNVVLLIATVLTACVTYALARRVTQATRPEAWLAGLAFAWSPALVARSTGHFSLVAAAPLAAFLLCLIVADRTRRTRHAALAGLCIAWAGMTDPYYAVYCLLIAAGYLAARVLRVQFAPRLAPLGWRWALNFLIVIIGGLVVGLLTGRSGEFELLGIPISVRGLYTPVFALTVLVIARAALFAGPRISLSSWRWSPSAVRAIAVAFVACAGPLSPVLYGLGVRIADGRFSAPETLWRSSPRGVDLLGLVEFNPNHFLARAVQDRQLADASVFVEYTAALSLVSLGVVGVAVWRARFRPQGSWVLLTAGFAALSLGPFIYIGGLNTHVPGPWALLRYVPLINAARTPTRFSIVAALGLAILLAAALAALGRRFPAQRRVIVATAAVLLLFELAPVPRPLYSADVPRFYHTIAADPRPVRVLELPFGVRDGTFTAGDFSARYLFNQTVHRKRLFGGYLSRVSQRRVRALRAQPTLDALMTMSEGGALSAEQIEEFKERAPGFLQRSRLGYVVVDETRAGPRLVEVVTDAWSLEEMAREGPLVLYRPRAPN